MCCKQMYTYNGGHKNEPGECTRTDDGKVIRQGQCPGETAAVTEHIFAEPRHGVGKHEGGETHAIVERRAADVCQ